MKSVMIIGGGAAGLSAAVASAMCGDQVTVLERMDRVGKKILATGNGRCNLMNAGEERYPGGAELAHAVLARMGMQEQKRFWEYFGLRMRQEDGGRVYPVSGAATTVLDTLRQAMSLMGVQEVTGVHVTSMRCTKRGWQVQAGDERYQADRVIVAGGGCAQPKLGSDGSTWDLLRAHGHHIIKPRPALTQVITDTDPIRGLSGIRVRTDVRVTSSGSVKHQESGELLFADYGVTGVCVMQCARYVEPGDTLHIDLTKAMGFPSPDAFSRELVRRRRLWGGAEQEAVQRDLLTGLCVPKVALALLRAAGIDRAHERGIDTLTDAQINRLVSAAADFRLKVKGVKGFESAQVTAGGADTREFDPKTMESLLVPGLHAAGEVLDVDGDCGGYNLMFAFGSGILAGLNGRNHPW